MTMMRKAGATRMDMALLQGSMFTGEESEARTIGLFTHVVMMSGLVLGSVYGLVFAVLGTDPGNAWWIGALLGLVHGLIAGLVIAMVPAIHPRVGSAAAGDDRDRGEVRLDPPGIYGKNYGKMTPPGVVTWLT